MWEKTWGKTTENINLFLHNILQHITVKHASIVAAIGFLKTNNFQAQHKNHKDMQDSRFICQMQMHI